MLTVFKEGGTRASIRDIVLPDMLQVFVDESAAAVYDPTPATAVPLDPRLNRGTSALRNARVQLPPEPPLAMPEPSFRAAQRKASEGDGPPGGGGSS